MHVAPVCCFLLAGDVAQPHGNRKGTLYKPARIDEHSAVIQVVFVLCKKKIVLLKVIQHVAMSKHFSDKISISVTRKSRKSEKIFREIKVHLCNRR